MTERVHEKITPHHHEQYAYVYVRQSTLKQVHQPHEGRQNQYALVQRALEQGRVVLAGDALLPFRFSYFFVCPEPYLVMPKVKRFRDWIFESAKSFPKPHSLFEKQSTLKAVQRKPAA